MCIRDSAAAASHHLVEIDGLRANEAPFYVRMDLACGLGGLGALFDGPGAALVLAVGQERDEADVYKRQPQEPSKVVCSRKCCKSYWVMPVSRQRWIGPNSLLALQSLELEFHILYLDHFLY